MGTGNTLTWRLEALFKESIVGHEIINSMVIMVHVFFETNGSCAGVSRGWGNRPANYPMEARNYSFNFLYLIMIICDDKTPWATLFCVSLEDDSLHAITMGSHTLPRKIYYCGNNLHNYHRSDDVLGNIV